MSLRKVFKAAGHYFAGSTVKIDEKIECVNTSNPEFDTTGGGFIWKIKTAFATAFKLRDDTAGEDILTIDTSAKTIALHPNYSGLQRADEHGWATYVDTIYTVGSPLGVLAATDTILNIHANTKIESQMPNDVNSFYYSLSLDLTGVTGTFVVGETITGGTSSATGVIAEIVGTTLNLHNTSLIVFSGAETITGGTSGATATVSVINDGIITGRDGDSLDFMIYFKAVPSAISQWLDIWIDIGGGVGELYRETFSFPKGASITRGVLYSIPSGYTLNTWESNGAKIYVRSDAAIDIYNININLDRTHKAI